MTHGTRTCYIGGCRQPECRQANNLYKRRYRAERLRVRDTFPPSDCGLCLNPISEHRPYYLCRISA